MGPAQLLVSGAPADVASKAKSLGGVTPADVAAAAKAALKGPVAVGAVGNTIYMPSYAKIATKFQ
jgi:hypothetical protein